MTNYAFQSKEVAEALSRVGKEAMRGVSSGIAPTGREHIYAKVPAEGIDGRSDTTCTSGVCTLVRFVTGELIEEADTNVEVYNASETDLEAGVYIEVFRVGAFWVFDGGSGGDPSVPKRVKFKLTESLLKEGVLPVQEQEVSRADIQQIHVPGGLSTQSRIQCPGNQYPQQNRQYRQ